MNWNSFSISIKHNSTEETKSFQFFYSTLAFQLLHSQRSFSALYFSSFTGSKLKPAETEMHSHSKRVSSPVSAGERLSFMFHKGKGNFIVGNCCNKNLSRKRRRRRKIRHFFSRPIQIVHVQQNISLKNNDQHFIPFFFAPFIFRYFIRNKYRLCYCMKKHASKKSRKNVKERNMYDRSAFQ